MELLFVLLITIGCGIFCMVQSDIENKTMEYSSCSQILYLKKRSAIAKKNIKIKRFYKEGVTYKPEEIVYSGMSIGGAFTGSAHINEAHYESFGIKTDKYLMYYKDEKKPIEKIVCSFDISQNSVISKYCTGTTIILENPDAKELNRVDAQIICDSMKNGNKIVESSIIGQHLEQKQLTKKECEIIKSWIGGEIE